MTASDRLDEQRYCKGCFYPLAGLQTHECPECGRGFDPSRPRTTSRNPQTTTDKTIATVVLVLTLLSVPAGLGVVVVSAMGAEPWVLWLGGVVVTPFAVMLLVAALTPAVRLARWTRALAVLCVLVVASVVLTGWPFKVVFATHRSALTEFVEQVRSGELTTRVGRTQIGTLPVFETRMTTDGSVGLQTMRWYGGGIWLVHTEHGSSVREFNTNWEQSLGGGWFRVYED